MEIELELEVEIAIEKEIDRERERLRSQNVHDSASSASGSQNSCCFRRCAMANAELVPMTIPAGKSSMFGEAHVYSQTPGCNFLTGPAFWTPEPGFLVFNMWVCRKMGYLKMCCLIKLIQVDPS